MTVLSIRSPARWNSRMSPSIRPPAQSRYALFSRTRITPCFRGCSSVPVWKKGLTPTPRWYRKQGVTRTPRGDASVMVVGEGDKVEVRQVTASQAIGDKWLVTDGLKSGDQSVIVTGLQKIKPGVQVKAQEVASDDKQQAAGNAPSRTNQVLTQTGAVKTCLISLSIAPYLHG